MYSADPIITMHHNVTAKDYVGILGDHVIPMAWRGSYLIHTSHDAQSWFDEYVTGPTIVYLHYNKLYI